MSYRERILSIVVTLLVFLCLTSFVYAEEQATNYSGDFWSKSTITGDWGGARNEWPTKGSHF